MYRVPSRKSKARARVVTRLNLIPILDSVFIFIFFLLMSVDYIKIYEISSDVPIISERKDPKQKKKPLALTITILKNHIKISTGVPSVVMKIVPKQDGNYNLNLLHSTLISLKNKHKNEKTVILEPIANINYIDLVKIMDSIRKLQNTDKAFYEKDKDGLDVRTNKLFSNIVFGNIQS